MEISVESLEVYAKLNFIRDKTTLVDGVPLLTENWDEVKDEYMDEAKHDKHIVLTLDEVNSMIQFFDNKEK